jgi:hypothetical protein
MSEQKGGYRLDYAPTNKAKCKGIVYELFSWDWFFLNLLNLSDVRSQTMRWLVINIY